ncbi:ArsR family transcriptional regulator [Salinadaptatus halalkaliphilus]|uniref:ArsR family transcriptional regulator n=1 Tax=Salinadaptatus halalkaliphilus TaxID=2419781 RepID=A0A4S3TKK6_9EURY|nr:ArsR family transcriptional regulator [Salinadaptatus halalkaliphilus]THE64672.1 ArsR family transcriptional regulator [Salinadaptatus halalkaliphilus]
MSSDARLGDALELDSLADVPADRYEVLCHPRRLRLLECLEEDRYRPLSAVTTDLLEREGASSSDGRKRHEVRCSLVHNHLPRLDAHDIITWDIETGIALADGLPICPSTITGLLEADDELEDYIEQVVDPVRIALLNQLADHDGPVSIESLAATLASRERSLPADTGRVKIRLHHMHLPALAAIDLLGYDRDTKQVFARDIGDAF